MSSGVALQTAVRETIAAIEGLATMTGPQIAAAAHAGIGARFPAGGFDDAVLEVCPPTPPSPSGLRKRCGASAAQGRLPALPGRNTSTRPLRL